MRPGSVYSADAILDVGDSPWQKDPLCWTTCNGTKDDGNRCGKTLIRGKFHHCRDKNCGRIFCGAHAKQRTWVKALVDGATRKMFVRICDACFNRK